ncbi:unnamed protein product [Urochloa humidicola]
MCLYGYANKAWEAALPAEEMPTELSELALERGRMRTCLATAREAAPEAARLDATHVLQDAHGLQH